MNTPFLDQVYVQVDFDRDLVFKFFTVFSLFEYALKNTQYWRDNNGKVEADWDSFARNIDRQYDIANSQALRDAIDYFFNSPPMKQVVENGQVVFRQRDLNPNITDTEKLAIYIRRVRNNLFHGGKFRYVRPRDPELIQHSMTILEAWAQCHNDLRMALETV